jgi:hypothetical protein
LRAEDFEESCCCLTCSLPVAHEIVGFQRCVQVPRAVEPTRIFGFHASKEPLQTVGVVTSFAEFLWVSPFLQILHRKPKKIISHFGTLRWDSRCAVRLLLKLEVVGRFSDIKSLEKKLLAALSTRGATALMRGPPQIIALLPKKCAEDPPRGRTQPVSLRQEFWPVLQLIDHLTKLRHGSRAIAEGVQHLRTPITNDHAIWEDCLIVTVDLTGFYYQSCPALDRRTEPKQHQCPLHVGSVAEFLEACR